MAWLRSLYADRANRITSFQDPDKRVDRSVHPILKPGSGTVNRQVRGSLRAVLSLYVQDRAGSPVQLQIYLHTITAGLGRVASPARTSPSPRGLANRLSHGKRTPTAGTPGTDVWRPPSQQAGHGRLAAPATGTRHALRSCPSQPGPPGTQQRWAPRRQPHPLPGPHAKRPQPPPHAPRPRPDQTPRVPPTRAVRCTRLMTRYQPYGGTDHLAKAPRTRLMRYPVASGSLPETLGTSGCSPTNTRATSTASGFRTPWSSPAAASASSSANGSRSVMSTRGSPCRSNPAA